ncbi:rhodanese-like domain-containing protein [Salaquimonas pukyongi]|uniref:rhodanese-like domain-containing protein n=1 Tax=Salaquimonas pukyongi TaxID=2712698 RepID=UPI00096BBCE4|nr:rhodanese-like domain-containing protein [Salaquimonas pukyongi]
MAITGVKTLVERANREITTHEPAEALARQASGAVLVDIRDIRELNREGRVEGAVHAPRGMLEFWFDPESPYHKEVFAQDSEYILFCAAGWRSALAAKTLKDMGFENIAHVDGGFGALSEQGATITGKKAES